MPHRHRSSFTPPSAAPQSGPAGALRAAAFAVIALAVAVPPARAVVTIEDLVTMTVPSEVAVSRDGKQVAWVSTLGNLDENERRSRLWLWHEKRLESLQKLKNVITGGETPKGYRVVTRREDDAESPAFSPDGDHLAFLAARGEDAKTQVWVLPLEGGEAEAWTDAAEGVDQFAWQPDGGLVYLASAPWPDGVRQWREQRRKAGYDADVFGEDRRPRGFWVVSPGGGEETRAYLGGPGIEDFVLSWSGESVVYRDNGTGDPADWNEINLFRVDLKDVDSKDDRRDDAGPRPVQLTTRWGDEWNPQWSHDDTKVFFLAGEDSMKSFSEVRIFSVPADSVAAPTPLFAELGHDLDTFHSAPGDNRLFATVITGTRTILCKLFPNSENVQRLVDEPGRVRYVAVSRSGEEVAFVQEGPNQAPEVCRWQFNNRHFDRLTRENEDLTAKADAQHDVVRWLAPDGLEIEGILVLPAGWVAVEGDDRPDGDRSPRGRYGLARRAADAAARGESVGPSGALPTLVVLHGGPASVAHDTIRWAEMDAFAGRGYAVFAPNFRGSQGYGASFCVASYRDLGGADFGDVMSGVDFLIEEGVADPERLGITGGSYGGFLTNVAITSTDRFAAAVSSFGMASLVTDFANSDYRTFEQDYLGANFWEEPELYERLSPLGKVGRVTTPTLIIHGANDTNTRPTNSRELFLSLLEADGAPVEFALYPREGHGIREPAHRIDEFRRTLGWFDHHLLGRDRTARVGGMVSGTDWSLTVRDAETRNEIGAAEGAWLVVDVVLSSKAPVNGREIALAGPDAAFRLVDAAGREIAPAGVPVDWNGTPHLVFGETRVTLRGDPATGSASWPFRVAFDVTNARPPASFRALDLPQVALHWPAQEDAEEKPE